MVQNRDELVERSRLARAEIVNSALFRLQRAQRSLYNVFHVNEIPFLLAVFENSRALPLFNLPGEMQNHARGNAFVRFARTVNIEITQSDDLPTCLLYTSPSPRDS